MGGVRELFGNTESYNMKTVVQDSRRYVIKNNPILPDESKEEYKERIFWLANDEISRRILISGKKRPNYKNYCKKWKKYIDILKKLLYKYKRKINLQIGTLIERN